MGRTLTQDEIDATIEACEKHRRPDGTITTYAVARELGLSYSATQHRVRMVESGKFEEDYSRSQRPAAIHDPKTIAVTIKSNKNNEFIFGACGDYHCGSKYARHDVREDLINWYEDNKVQAIFDTGNWCDGEATFNRFDLDVVGMDAQIKLLAEKHPKTSMPIYAITGDDHEGWWEQRSGVDIGAYAQRVMKEAGHKWHDLGYMEAYVKLVNANTGKEALLSVVHPGGGSAYALSYAIQKLLESLEGGEKPNVGLYGHYHKLWAGADSERMGSANRLRPRPDTVYA